MNDLSSIASFDFSHCLVDYQNNEEQAPVPEEGESRDKGREASVFAFLKERNIVDSNCTLLDAPEMANLPLLNSSQLSVIESYLDQKLFGTELSLKRILDHLLFQYGRSILQIQLVGGFARKVIMESPEYVSCALEQLTGLTPEELKGCVDQIKGYSEQRELPDIDIRIYTSLQTEEDLKSFTNCIVDYLGLYVYYPEAHLSKFHVIFEDRIQYSIATIRANPRLEYEFLFVLKLTRQHLFSLDSFYLLFEGSEMRIGNSSGNEWQAFIHLLTRSLEVQNPETVNHFGFPRLLSYLIQGCVPINEGTIEILEKQTFKELNLQPDPIYSLHTLLCKTTRNHHFDDPVAANMLTLTCCFHLPWTNEEKFQLYALMRAQYWKGGVDLKHSFLKAIDSLLWEENIPFSTLSATLAVFSSISRFPALPYTFYLPMPLEEAVDELIDFLRSEKPSEPLFHLLFSSTAPSDKSSPEALDRAVAYVRSKCPEERFLGCLLLIPFRKHPATFPLLLKHFIFALHRIPDSCRPSFLSLLERNFGAFSPFARFNEAFQPDRSEKDQMIEWVQALLKDPETPLEAHDIWIRCRGHYQTKRHMIDGELILALLPEYPGRSLRLFERIQDEPRRSKNELSLLNSVLNWFLQHPSHIPSFSEQVGSVISRSLENLKRTLPSHFAAALAQYLAKLIEAEETDLAYALLLQAAEYPELQSADFYECRLKLCGNPNYPLDLCLKRWKEIALSGPCPSELTETYQRVHFHLVERLLDSLETSQEGFYQLRLYAESAPLNQGFPALAERDIQQLIETGQIHAALTFFEDLYQTQFRKENRQTIRKQLFDKFVQSGFPDQAYFLWKKIQPDYPETTRKLLNLLTQEGAPQKYLKKAYRWINQELKNGYLSPDECLLFYQKIYDQDPSQGCLETVLIHCFENRLVGESSFDALLSMLGNLSQPLSSSFEKAILESIDGMLQLLLAREEYRKIDRLVELLEEIRIDASLAGCFYQLSEKLIFYHLDLGNVEKLIRWMRHALNGLHSFRERLPDILVLSKRLGRAGEALIYLEFAAEIKEMIERGAYLDRLETLVRSSEIDFETAILLLDYFPPFESSPWDSLLERAAGDQFENVWNAYYSWLSNSPKASPQLLDTTIKMIGRFSHLTSRPEISLIESLSCPDSPLGRLDDGNVLHGHLILSHADHIQAAIEWEPLYSVEWIDRDDFILPLIDRLIAKPQNELFLFGLDIFYHFMQERNHYTEKMHSIMLRALEKGKMIEDSNSFTRLLAISKRGFALNPSQNQLLEIASALSAFENPELLHESLNFLLALKPAPDSEKIWESLLPKYLELCLREETGGILSFFQAYIDRIERGSAAYLRCVDRLFSITIHNLYQNKGEFVFSAFFLNVFRSLFKESIPFNAAREVVEGAYCPVLSINEGSSENDRREFFFYMSSFLSLLIDQDPVEEEVEMYVEEFLFCNLLELCAHYPNEHGCLVNLLDRYYFRHPPGVDPIFSSHIEKSLVLLFNAINSDIYDEYQERMKASMIYLKFKVCYNRSKPESVIDQFPILEGVIDRVLAFQTPAALLRTVFVMQGVQWVVVEHNQKAVLRIYKKIIGGMDFDPMFTYQGIALFEWIRMGIMQKNPMIGYSPHNEGRITATRLCESLFEKVYAIFQSIDLFNSPRYTANDILVWLGEFLILSRKHGGYWDWQGAKLYYARVKTILPHMIQAYHELAPSQQENAGELMVYVIAGYGFSKIDGFTKKNKLLRCKLMSEWLITVSLSLVWKEFDRICQDLKVYEGFPKEYQRMLKKVNEKKLEVVSV